MKQSKAVPIIRLNRSDLFEPGAGADQAATMKMNLLDTGDFAK